MELKIHYKTPEIKELYKNCGIMTEESAGFDLCCTEDTHLEFDKLNMIDFGVVIQPPKGYHTELVPRSSTFKKLGLILANSIGIIDRDYSGLDDTLKGMFLFSPVAQGDLKEDRSKKKYFIPKGTRIAQILIRKTETFTLQEFQPKNKSRGGIGSTGS